MASPSPRAHIVCIGSDRAALAEIERTLSRSGEAWEVYMHTHIASARRRVAALDDAVVVFHTRRAKDPELNELLNWRSDKVQPWPKGSVCLLIMPSAELDPEAHRFPEGVEDILTEPYNAAQLIARVRLCADLTLARKAQHQAFDQLDTLRHIDPITGLPNPQGAQARMSAELARVGRGQYGLSLAFIDLDGFQDFIASEGKEVAERSLQSFSRILLQCVREYDLVVRWGEDQFVIMLPMSDLDIAETVMERIQSSTQQSPIRFSTHGLAQTFCAGVVEVAPNQLREIEQVLKNASKTLRDAKLEGPGTIKFAHETRLRLAIRSA